MTKDKFKYPWMRKELEIRLLDLLDLNSLLRHWEPTEGNLDGFSEYIDFFIDGNELDESAIRSVGIFLLPGEVESVKEVAMVLRDIAREIGPSYDSMAALNHRRWHEVMSSSSKALDILMKNDERIGFGG